MDLSRTKTGTTSSARATGFPSPAVIAVDGPSGSGKSTVAKGVARRLGWRYLDTGAMYRALTWRALQDGVPLDDAEALTALAGRTEIDISTDPEEPRVAVDGHDVTREIREADVTAAVSAVSAVPGVRETLVAAQREFAALGSIVVEGRDIGSVVIPHAPLKVYLTAHPTARAQRRAREFGRHAEHEVRRTEDALARRDRLDSSRTSSPLAKAQDAVEVDTTERGIDESIQALIDLWAEVCAAAQPSEASTARSPAMGDTAAGR